MTGIKVWRSSSNSALFTKYSANLLLVTHALI